MTQARVKLFKWGNSLAFKLPPELVTEMNLSLGDDMQIDPSGRRELIIRRKGAPGPEAPTTGYDPAPQN